MVMITDGNGMETMVMERKLKSGTLCLKKKRLVDNLLDTLYEKGFIT